MWTASHASFPFYIHISTYPSPSPRLILKFYLLCTFFSSSAHSLARLSPVTKVPYPLLYLLPFFCLPSFKISSLPPQTLIPPNCASSGLSIIIFLSCPGVSNTVGSFHLETCFVKPLLYLFLFSLLLPSKYFFLGSLTSSFPYALWMCVPRLSSSAFSFFLPFLPSAISSVSQTLTAANILVTQKFDIFLEPAGQLHLDILEVISKLIHPKTNSLARFFIIS